jgi:hypothetical protein
MACQFASDDSSANSVAKGSMSASVLRPSRPVPQPPVASALAEAERQLKQARDAMKSAEEEAAAAARWGDGVWCDHNRRCSSSMPSPICERICRQVAAMRAESDAAAEALLRLRGVEEDSAEAEKQLVRLRWVGDGGVVCMR